MLRILLLIISSLLIAGCKLGSGGSNFSDAAGSASSFAATGGGGDGGVAALSALSSGAGIATYSNPEPSSMVLLGIGLGGLVLAAFKKKKKS